MEFLLLFTVIHFGCWYEFHRLMDKIDLQYPTISDFQRVLIALLGFSFMLYATRSEDFPFGPSSLHEIGLWLLIALLILFFGSRIFFWNKVPLTSLLSMMAGFCYISLSWGLMLKLRSDSFVSFAGNPDWIIPVILIASIWINDTMAYITGSFIGKTKLSTISPNKTWEGTIAGVILAVAIVAFGGNTWFHLPFWPLVLISAVGSIVGTFGDLLESKLKRLAGVKDSGQMMPGHGGFLDRFDSMILATPVLWLLAALFFKQFF